MPGAAANRQLYNFLNPPAPQFIELLCQSASVLEGSVLVVGTSDNTLALPSGADVANGVIGIAAFNGAADTSHPIKCYLGGFVIARAKGTITRGNQLTVGDSTGAVKALSATTAESAQIIGIAMESATDGQTFFISIDLGGGGAGSQSVDQVPFHSVRGVCTTNQSTTAFASVSGGTIIDGVTYAAGDRVLLAGQTTANQNGPWVVGIVAAGVAPLTRPVDFVSGATMPAMTLIGVSEGIANANTVWKQTTAGSALVIDTSSITFQPITSAQAGGFHTCRGVCWTNQSITAFASVTAGTIIDGVTYAQGDRVLLAGQTTANQNGPWVVGPVAAGAAPLSRPADYASGMTALAETYVSVSEGTLRAHSLWRATTAGSAKVIDTDSIAFAQCLDAGQSVNPRVRCVAAAAITISTALVTGQVIDGVTLAAGDRVLVVNQATPGDNGIYEASAAPAAHVYAPDYVQGAVKAGLIVYVSEGTRFANSAWAATAAQASTGGYYTVGTTDPVFMPQFNNGVGAVGTVVTNAFIAATSSPLIAIDQTAAAALKGILVAGRGNGTITWTGTGTDTVLYSVKNWG